MPQLLSKKLLSRNNMTSLEEVHRSLKLSLLKLPREHLSLMVHLLNKPKRTNNQTSKQYHPNSKSRNSYQTSEVSILTKMICTPCNSSKCWCNNNTWCKTRWIWAWISTALACKTQWEAINSWQTTNNQEWASKTTKDLSHSNNSSNPTLILKTSTNSSRIINSKCQTSSRITQQQHLGRLRE